MKIKCQNTKFHWAEVEIAWAFVIVIVMAIE